MAKITPFKGLRPTKELAAEVATLPYDVVSVAEHNWKIPVIGAGTGLTVILAIAVQPPPRLSTIIAGPGLIPVTTPVVEPTEAIAGLLLNQTEVPEASVIVIDAPTQT